MASTASLDQKPVFLIINEILERIGQYFIAAYRFKCLFFRLDHTLLYFVFILYWNASYFIFYSFYSWLLAIGFGGILLFRIVMGFQFEKGNITHVSSEFQNSLPKITYSNLFNALFNSQNEAKTFLSRFLVVLRTVQSTDALNLVLLIMIALMLFKDPLLFLISQLKMIMWMIGNAFFLSRLSESEFFKKLRTTQEFESLLQQLSESNVESLEREDDVNAIFHLRYNRNQKILIKTFSVFENQRWWLGIGWCKELFSCERGAWSNDSGSVSADSLEALAELGGGWQWLDAQWLIETSPSFYLPQDAVERCSQKSSDDSGWQYSASTRSWRHFYWNSFFKAVVRRRHWVRRAAFDCDEARSLFKDEFFLHARFLLNKEHT